MGKKVGWEKGVLLERVRTGKRKKWGIVPDVAKRGKVQDFTMVRVAE